MNGGRPPFERNPYRSVSAVIARPAYSRRRCVAPAGTSRAGQRLYESGECQHADGRRAHQHLGQNPLVQCAYNGTTTTNTYACDGLRHRSVVGANTTDYVPDSSMFVRELLNATVKAAATTTSHD